MMCHTVILSPMAIFIIPMLQMRKLKKRVTCPRSHLLKEPALESRYCDSKVCALFIRNYASGHRDNVCGFLLPLRQHRSYGLDQSCETYDHLGIMLFSAPHKLDSGWSQVIKIQLMKLDFSINKPIFPIDKSPSRKIKMESSF